VYDQKTGWMMGWSSSSCNCDRLNPGERGDEKKKSINRRFSGHLA